MKKVLVVDDGARGTDHALSAELAELGLASVTTSFEAADEVLELVEPAAILVQLPDRRISEARYAEFLKLAARLKSRRDSCAPVILVDGRTGAPLGGHSAWRDTFGAHAVSLPEL